MARLSIRVDFDTGGAVGPGKIRLLELIGELGSISAAGRAMAMSYRRAWLLVDQLNCSFAEPVVAAHHGGSSGGGAALTLRGQELIQRYRRIVTDAERAAASDLLALQSALVPRESRAAGTPVEPDLDGGED
jgi:molybdate transport system regulatory protein